MDSLTQIALGAAMGEAAAGSRAGNKAVLWGAVAGTIPDLDILFNAFVDSVDELAMHRGISHSFVFSVLAAPVFGWLVRRVHPNGDATFRDWTLVGFLSFVTHILLDYLTIYGTQLFRPFSDYPAALGSVFIIDPLYTVPLAFGVIMAMRFARTDIRRRRWNAIGITISSVYLLFSIAAKFQAVDVFEKELARQQIAHDRLFVAPMPLNTVLWMALAEDSANDQLWVGLYSFLDPDGARITFRAIPRNSNLIAGGESSRALSRLFWFSHGYYHVDQNTNGELVFNDLRFGRSDGWLDETGQYIFAFVLQEDRPGSKNFVGFERRAPDLTLRGEQFSRLARRISGQLEAANANEAKDTAGECNRKDPPC